MQLKWVTAEEGAKMSEYITQAMLKGFSPGGFTIMLEGGEQIRSARLIGVTSGNNAGRNGQWLYYGSITVEAKDGYSYVIDASLIKQVL